jgi:hypothetical protein
MILDHTSELVWPVIERAILHFVQDDSMQKATVARLSRVR